MSLRRVLAFGLILEFSVFEFEIAINSVPHLFEPAAAAHCGGVTVFAHVSAAGGARATIECPPISVREAPTSAGAARVEAPLPHASRERAPPTTSF